MRQDFPEALRTALAKALDSPIARLERFEGRTVLNFKAVRESDGVAFAVKCFPPERHDSFLRLARYVDALGDGGGKVAARILVGTFDRFEDYDVMCFSWCDGVRMFPDQLSESQTVAMAKDYLKLSDAMQRIVPEGRQRDLPDMRRRALEVCRGWWASGVRRLLEDELTEERITLRPELCKVIHGDLHHGNFLFKDGAVAGFFDFECIAYGYPAEDFIRYFVCAAEHLRWYNQHRKIGILHLFETVVESTPYSYEEWKCALDRSQAGKLCWKVLDYGCGPLMSVNLLFRAGFYGKLRRAAARACKRRDAGKTV